MQDNLTRCAWATGVSAIEVDYHDTQWGVPCHNDQSLFEMLILEGAQAGLSWSTILNKRAGYHLALDGFDANKMARYDAHKKESLRHDARIVRNRLKIEAAVTNARAFLDVIQVHDSFANFVWQFVDGNPIINRWADKQAIPTSTPLSERLSKTLKQYGFKFVGATICYAYMQAVGMVNDHTCDCFRYAPLSRRPYFSTE